MAGLLLAGAGAGHLLWPQPTAVITGDTDSPTSLPMGTGTPSAGPAGADAGGTLMPDVLGLDAASARQVFTDYSITTTLSTTTTPAAGAPGRVIAQKPRAGEAIGPVTLTLSSATPMPNVAGTAFTTARDQLQKLGANVLIRRVVRPQAQAGTVLSTTPAAGANLPQQVELAIADPGELVLWSQLRAGADGGCAVVDNTPTSVGGQQVTGGVSCRPGQEARYAEAVTAGRAQLFVATLGLDDTAGREPAQVAVYGDDLTRPLKRVTVGSGKATALSVPIRGVIRLRVQVTGPAEATSRVIFGDAGVLGDPVELDQVRTS